MSDRESQRDPLVARVTRFVHREGKRVGVGLTGGVIVVLGIILMPLPGPGTLIVLAGLAVLATQFAWARELRDRIRDRAREALDRIRASIGDDDPSDGDGRVDPPHHSEVERRPVGGRSDVA